MKNNYLNRFFSDVTRISVFMLFSTLPTFATLHVVAFGGSNGLSYSPKTFTAVVGDTVRWEGSFSAHPLSSTTIPSAATKWHEATGSTFTYVIKVAGDYSYQCDLHVALGMVGSFTVSEAQVSNRSQSSLEKISNPVTLSISTTSEIALLHVNNIHPFIGSIKVFDLSGREVATLTNGILSAGNHEIPLQRNVVKAGYYFVQMKSETFQQVVRFATKG